jgi:hypothetical protein
LSAAADRFGTYNRRSAWWRQPLLMPNSAIAALNRGLVFRPRRLSPSTARFVG